MPQPISGTMNQVASRHRPSLRLLTHSLHYLSCLYHFHWLSMVYSDNTATFKDLIVQGSSRPTSPTRAKDISRARDKGKGKEGDEVFLQEAYRIVSTSAYTI